MRLWEFLLELDQYLVFCKFLTSFIIQGASGGVTEAILRTAAASDKVVSRQLLMQSLRGFNGVKTAYVNVAGKRIRVAVVHGTSNVRRFIDSIMQTGLDKCGYHFVEIMVCPGGCIGGGGQAILLLLLFCLTSEATIKFS